MHEGALAKLARLLGEPKPDPRIQGISPLLYHAATEIERLRDRVTALRAEVAKWEKNYETHTASLENSLREERAKVLDLQGQLNRAMQDLEARIWR